jgi:hypothetical protein
MKSHPDYGECAIPKGFLRGQNNNSDRGKWELLVQAELIGGGD